MVCVTITRDPLRLGAEVVLAIRDALHEAIVKAVKVQTKDVELRVRNVGLMDVNTPPLAVDIRAGPGKGDWRLGACKELLLAIDELVLPVVPDEFRVPGQSNIWLTIYAKGASMPFGRPDLLH
jgi:hypothetical protein